MDEWAIVIAIVAFGVAWVNRSKTPRHLEEALADLTRRVQRLELDLELLRGTADPAPPAGQVMERPGQPTPRVTPGRAPEVQPRPLTPSSGFVAASVASAAGVPLVDELQEVVDAELPPAPPRQAQPAPPIYEPFLRRVRSSEEWELLIGGRWMNRIGAFALILGVGFFLKYAIANGWVPQALQVAMAALLGAGLLAVAWRARARNYAVFAQGLVGAGIATLYLSVYASSNSYHLVPTPVALAAMAIVTSLALAQSLYYDSLAVALLGWAGGFLTIPLLGMSGGNEIGTLGYLLLLDAEILVIVFARDPWFVLEPLTMGATYAIYIAWYFGSEASDKVILAGIALTLFWGLFLALDILRIRYHVTTYRGLRHVLGGANALVYYAAMFALLRDHRWALGLVTLAIGLVYISTILVSKRGLRGDDSLDARYTLTAILLAVVATPIMAGGFTVAMFWSLEALAILWCGVHWKLHYVWRPALGLFGLASVFLLAIPGALRYEPISAFRPLVNERALAFIVVAASCALGALVLRHLEDRRRATFTSSLHYGWCSLVFLLLTVETNDHFQQAIASASGLTKIHLEFTRSLIVAAVWMAYSLPLVWYGLRTRIFPILSMGLAIAALALGAGLAIGASYQPIEWFTPVLNIRVGILVLLLAGVVAHYLWLRRERGAYAWIGMVIGGYQAAIILIGFELLTAEIHDAFRHQTGAVSEHAAGQSGLFIELMTLAAVWMLYSFPLVRYGVRNRALTVLLAGLASVGGATGVGAVAAFAFVPTNWLGLALSLRPIVLLFLGVGLFLQIRWIREGQRSYEWLDAVLVAMQASTVLLGFELFSAQTRDAVQYQITLAQAKGAPADVDRWENLQQLTLSVVWLLYALGVMIVGLWQRMRWLRLGAMALLGFIILKIFLYDLAFLSPAYRSISFAGLGVILLGVSYLYQRYRALLFEAR